MHQRQGQPAPLESVQDKRHSLRAGRMPGSIEALPTQDNSNGMEALDTRIHRRLQRKELYSQIHWAASKGTCVKTLSQSVFQIIPKDIPLRKQLRTRFLHPTAEIRLMPKIPVSNYRQDSPLTLVYSCPHLLQHQRHRWTSSTMQ